MPEPLTLLSLNHVARPTKHLAESYHFYVDILGARELSRPPFSFRGYWLYVAGIQVHLIESAETPDSPLEVGTQENHIAFAVPDLDAMEGRLREHQVRYLRNMIPGREIHQIFFRDPDGWLIEISGNYSAIDR